LTHYLDEESARRLSSARGRRDELVTSVVGWYLNLVIAGPFTFVLGMVAFVALTMRSGHLAPADGYGLMELTVAAVVLVLIRLLKVKREAPERVVGFLQKLGFYRDKG
jgi:hypothetical protein